MTRRLPWRDGPLVAHAEDVAAGRIAPARPRDAATVMLLRPAAPGTGAGGVPGVEVFLMRRVRAMRFAPGAHVFPGGSVDGGDADPDVGWAGPAPAEFGGWLGTSADQARALVCAAVRETFEECGVLLAAAGPDAAPPVPDGEEWERDRADLARHAASLAGVLRRRGLVVRADLLTPWSRWITPEAEPRRFDARFFAAAVPPGQRASGAGAGEADGAAWLRPSAAIDSARAGELTLLPPTAVTLREFAACGAVTQILGQRRRIVPLMPRIYVEDGRAWVTLPEEVEYPL